MAERVRLAVSEQAARAGQVALAVPLAADRAAEAEREPEQEPAREAGCSPPYRQP